MFNINFAKYWSCNADLWYQKQPLYQLSHNHFPCFIELAQGMHFRVHFQVYNT